MRLISGIQPSGTITLGNYLGAVKNFVQLQQQQTDDLLFFIADLHAITVPQDRLQLKNNIRSLAALYLACGLDPSKMHLFVQSEVQEHTQLSWILQCNTYIGELERMTQFKDKKAHKETGVSSGLLTYPVLMAADILLYDADVVPVGADQKQHLEMARTIAERINSKYGPTFTVPEPYLPKLGAKIMSLTDPSKKMSKSDSNPKSFISLLDDPVLIEKKIKSAVTDSEAKIHYDPTNKPGISNLMTIYAILNHQSLAEVENKFKNETYATFKNAVAQAVIAEIQPIQERYRALLQSPQLDQILDEGRDYATALARKKMQKVLKKVGLTRKK